jgi:hypothetical protein
MADPKQAIKASEDSESSDEESSMEIAPPSQLPSNPPNGNTDMGGLGGAALHTTGPIAPTAEERRLKQNIRYLKQKHPHVDLNKFSELENQLLYLKKDELKDILESIKSQIGGMHSIVLPYAAICLWGNRRLTY